MTGVCLCVCVAGLLAVLPGVLQRCHVSVFRVLPVVLQRCHASVFIRLRLSRLFDFSFYPFLPACFRRSGRRAAPNQETSLPSRR